MTEWALRNGDRQEAERGTAYVREGEREKEKIRYIKV